MIKLDSQDALEDWLRDKPKPLIVTIASRIALRALPVVVDPAIWSTLSEDWQTKRQILILSVFRANAIMRFAKFSIYKINISTRAAAAALVAGAHTDARADAAALAAAAAANAHAHANAAAGAGYTSYAAALAVAAGASDVSWEAISADCGMWEAGEASPDEMRALPLWPTVPPPEIADAWQAFKATPGVKSRYGTFIRWYDRRISGAKYEFLAKGEAEMEMARHLIEVDEVWWNRTPEEINSDLEAWIDELQPQSPSEKDFQQNTYVPMFGEGPSDQIDTISPTGRSGEADPEGFASRYELVRSTLQDALSASSHGRTQAIEISGTIAKVLDALGDAPGRMRAAHYVVFSKKLRASMRDHLAYDSFKPPFAEKQREELETWLDADSILITLDDELSRIEKATYATRLAPVEVEREELRDLIGHIKRASIATIAAEDILMATVDDVPAGAGQDNSDLRNAEQTAENFLRAFGRKIWAIGKATGDTAHFAWKPGLEFAKWIAEHSDKLNIQFPGLTPVIDFIAKWF